MKIAMVFAALLTASCSDGGGAGMALGGVNPLAPRGTSGGASAVVIQPIVTIASCPSAPAFTPSVTLVVRTGSPSSTLAFDTVTFRLISGSSIGGPTVTYPKAGLMELFGTTAIAGMGTFVFTPSFACGFGLAHALAADVTLLDPSTNVRKVVSVSADLR
jgi:hypothetical protein